MKHGGHNDLEQKGRDTRQRLRCRVCFSPQLTGHHIQGQISRRSWYPRCMVDTGDAPAIDTGSGASAARLRLTMGLKIRVAVMMATSMTYMNGA